MSENILGELEQVVLLAVLRLGDDAYSGAIQAELDARAGRSVSLGTLYVTLSRMERKGLVSSELGDPTPVRGGRPKRYYRETDDGIAALQRARRALDRLWSGVDLPSGGGRR